MYDTKLVFWYYFATATYLGVIALKLRKNTDIRLRQRIFVVGLSTTLACIFALSAHYSLKIVSEKLATEYSFLITGVAAIISDSILMSVLKYPGNINIETIGNSWFSSSAYYFTAMALAMIPVIVLWVVVAIFNYFVILFS
jgi:hypothetical protein